MRRAFAVLSFILTLVSTASPAFAKVNMCGGLDVSRISNDDLQNIVMMSDLSEGRRGVRRGQCGLPGERLNICSACSNGTSEAQMRILRPMIGEKSHLAWHADWHELRGTIAPLTPAVYREAQNSGLVPKSVSFQDFTSQYTAEGSSLGGENFLYMHRLMIKMVQLELAGNGQPCFAPWNDVPASVDDATWPVPKRFATPVLKDQASAQLEAMRTLLTKLRSPKLLKNVTLNRLGQLVEPRIHLQLHGFYQSTPRCSPEARAQGFCDDLVPVGTSPLNKHFWKIHGLVDQLVGDWLTAHGYTEISVACGGRRGCYQWQGTWIGRYPRG